MRSEKGGRVAEPPKLSCELTSRETSSCMPVSDWGLDGLIVGRRRSDVKSLKSCLMSLAGPVKNGRTSNGSLGVLRCDDMPPIIS